MKSLGLFDENLIRLSRIYLIYNNNKKFFYNGISLIGKAYLFFFLERKII